MRVNKVQSHIKISPPKNQRHFLRFPKMLIQNDRRMLFFGDISVKSAKFRFHRFDFYQYASSKRSKERLQSTSLSSKMLRDEHWASLQRVWQLLLVFFILQDLFAMLKCHYTGAPIRVLLVALHIITLRLSSSAFSKIVFGAWLTFLKYLKRTSEAELIIIHPVDEADSPIDKTLFVIWQHHCE